MSRKTEGIETITEFPASIGACPSLGVDKLVIATSAMSITDGYRHVEGRCDPCPNMGSRRDHPNIICSIFFFASAGFAPKVAPS
jgi:hypothetical protein